MRAIKAAALMSVLLFSGLAVAAPPHSIDYSKKPRNPGTIVSIGGQDYVIVRIPVADFNGNRYSISFPAPLTAGLLQGAGLTTTHATDPIQSNATIDGFPAQVSVSDQRTYAISSDFSESGTNRFLVNASATGIVTIQIGSMYVTLGESLDNPNPSTGEPPETDVNIGNSFSAITNAEWYKRNDLVARVIFLDQLIDYITIYSWQ